MAKRDWEQKAYEHTMYRAIGRMAAGAGNDVGTVFSVLCSIATELKQEDILAGDVRAWLRDYAAGNI